MASPGPHLRFGLSGTPLWLTLRGSFLIPWNVALDLLLCPCFVPRVPCMPRFMPQKRCQRLLKQLRAAKGRRRRGYRASTLGIGSYVDGPFECAGGACQSGH